MISDPAPFIVGSPRSGTTLLRLMLDAHPALAIPSETHFLFDVVRSARAGDFDAESLYRVVTGHFTWSDFGIEGAAFREALVALAPFTIADGLRAFYRLYAARFGKSRWGEKTPDYGFIMTDLQDLLREAHFIHIIRDGRDVALSKRHLWFGPGNDIAAQAEDWTRWILRARAMSGSCRHYMEVRYEDLVNEPAKVLREVCSFIDLPFTEQMLRYHERTAERAAELKGWPAQGVTAEQLLSLGRLTGSPPQKDRLARWKNEMSPEESATFEEIAGALLTDLGYEAGTAPGVAKRSASAVYAESELSESSKPFVRMGMMSAAEVQHVSVDVPTAPTEVLAGETFEVLATIVNRTNRTLCSLAPFPVRISYHWIDEQSQAAALWDGERTELDPPLQPGESARLPVSVTAPGRAGRYLLEITLVQEGIRWFEEVDSWLVRELPIAVRSTAVESRS